MSSPPRSARWRKHKRGARRQRSRSRLGNSGCKWPVDPSDHSDRAIARQRHPRVSCGICVCVTAGDSGKNQGRYDSALPCEYDGDPGTSQRAGVHVSDRPRSTATAPRKCRVKNRPGGAQGYRRCLSQVARGVLHSAPGAGETRSARTNSFANRALAWQLQEGKFGGLTTATRRRLRVLAHAHERKKRSSV